MFRIENSLLHQRSPKIISGLKDVVVEEGKHFEIMAEIDPGVPEAHCVWKRNDLVIPSNLYYRFELLNNRAVLKIEEIFIEDSAVYTLEVKNLNGIATTSARLTVKRK